MQPGAGASGKLNAEDEREFGPALDGVAGPAPGRARIEELLAVADAALYRTRSNGRGRVALAPAAVPAAATDLP